MMKNERVKESGNKIEVLALSASELAELLGVSVRHVRRMHSAGKLPEPIRIGKCVRWVFTEIYDWLKAGSPDRKKWNSIKEAKNGRS